jgi:hypothetical protein
MFNSEPQSRFVFASTGTKFYVELSLIECILPFTKQFKLFILEGLVQRGFGEQIKVWYRTTNDLNDIKSVIMEIKDKVAVLTTRNDITFPDPPLNNQFTKATVLPEKKEYRINPKVEVKYYPAQTAKILYREIQV